MSEHKFCYKYPHPSVTADCVIFGFDGVSIKVLLIQRGIEPFKGKWAFPGGFMKIHNNASFLTVILLEHIKFCPERIVV